LHDRAHLLLGNFLLLGIVHLETDSLRISHWLFEFFLHLVVHSPVLEAVMLHLRE
jgi:hypothetical protein